MTGYSVAMIALFTLWGLCMWAALVWDGFDT